MFSLLSRTCSNISFTSSLRVDVLQFDNDVNNKSFEYHELITHSFIHSLVLLLNQSLKYYPPPEGVVYTVKLDLIWLGLGFKFRTRC